jgi:predicted nuclease of restriction endonuclease-like (RecB) superfamily
MRNLPEDYKNTLKVLKETILENRYYAAKAVNTNMLRLYFFVGGILSEKAKNAQWGDKVLEKVSGDLQIELPGLKGFSAQNLKKMRVVYETWENDLLLLDHDNKQNGSPAVNQLESNDKLVIGSALPNQSVDTLKISSALPNQIKEHFWNIGFTHHYFIASKTNSIEERVYYIEQTVLNSWSSRSLEYHLKSKLFYQKDKAVTNFSKTVSKKFHSNVLQQFKDEYLLDYINIEESEDERVLESEIVINIKNFLMSLGTGFTFIGNQYRLMLDGEQFFIDLLFYNRQIQALIAIELKKGKFKPEYAGQLNFYLNVLDEKVKLPHEKPSIGVILCKEKNNTVVEYALGNIKKTMGVATYKTANELPKEYKQIMPPQEELIKLLNNK